MRYRGGRCSTCTRAAGSAATGGWAFAAATLAGRGVAGGWDSDPHIPLGCDEHAHVEELNPRTHTPNTWHSTRRSVSTVPAIPRAPRTAPPTVTANEASTPGLTVVVTRALHSRVTARCTATSYSTR